MAAKVIYLKEGGNVQLSFFYMKKQKPRSHQKYVGVPSLGNSSDQNILRVIFCFTARGITKRMCPATVHIPTDLDGSGQLDVVESRTFSVR